MKEKEKRLQINKNGQEEIKGEKHIETKRETRREKQSRKERETVTERAVTKRGAKDGGTCGPAAQPHSLAHQPTFVEEGRETRGVGTHTHTHMEREREKPTERNTQRDRQSTEK